MMTTMLRLRYGALTVLALGLLSVFIYSKSEQLFPPEVALSSIADCLPDWKNNNRRHNDECLKKTIDQLFERYSTQDLLRYIHASSTPPEITGFCHGIAHDIGRVTYQKLGTMEKSLAACSDERNVCRNGCAHGVIASAVADELGELYIGEDIVHSNFESVTKLGKKYCSGSDNLCHGMGHILELGAQNLDTSLAACDEVAPRHLRELCYEGVIMEGSGQYSFVESRVAMSNEKNDFTYPCKTIDPKFWHACFRYLPRYQALVFEENATPLSKRFEIRKQTCESFESRARSECFYGLGYLINDSQTDPTSSGTSRCTTLADIDQDSCMFGFAQAHSNYARYTDAFLACGETLDANQRKLCYFSIFQEIHYRNRQAQIRDACENSSAKECLEFYAIFSATKELLPDYYREGMLANI
jgi:hypothetical protein